MRQGYRSGIRLICAVSLESKEMFWRFARASTNLVDPLEFGVDSAPHVRDRFTDLLGSCGPTLLEAETLGHETGMERAWGVFAIAIVQ